MKLQLMLAVVLCLGTSAAVAISSAGEQEVQPAPEQRGDAAQGKLVFERRCTGCHALDADREGPRLGNVYGRKAGSVAGFQYSRERYAARD